MTGLYVVLGVLVLATLAGLVWRKREGRVRARAATLPLELRAELDLSAEVTLVQLSTTFCAPCRQTKALLGELAGRTAGLAHVDIDVTDRTRLAEQLRVLRTPTTLAVDSAGHELFRMSGVPRRAELDHALSGHLTSASHQADGAPE